MLDWAKCALCRAIRTFCQTGLGYLTAATLLSEVSWLELLSASALAAVISILTSIVSLPEWSKTGSDTDTVTETVTVDESTETITIESDAVTTEESGEESGAADEGGEDS